MRTIAIIPAYNEEKRIVATVASICPFVDGVIVVDDGSSDATAHAARVAGANVFIHALNRGQGAGLRTGTEAALKIGAECLVHIDADGQHDPSFIPAMLAPIRAREADIVLGSRFMGVHAVGMPFSRRMLHVAIRFFNVFAMGIPRRMTDPQSGMRAMTADAARRIPFTQDRMAHCSEILRLVTHSDLRWVEVPIRVRYTDASLAKGQKSRDALKIVWQLFLGAFK